MRLTAPRFTIRRWMVAVAVICVICYLDVLHRRSASFQDRANWYRLQAGAESSMCSFIYRHKIDADNLPMSESRKRRLRYIQHLRDLETKYRRAANHPWQPVSPDPPAPPR